MKKQKVVVAMSGGVDSTIAAALLLEEGYKVMGLFMRQWAECEDASLGTDSLAKAEEDARRLAASMGIELYVRDLKDLFQKKIIDYFINEYLAGKTPNPCILCNRYIKFGELYTIALGLGADYFATGHYARIEKNMDGRWLLKRGLDYKKDQSYALYNLNQKQLSQILLPLGGLEKKDVRAKAFDLGLAVSEKKDSQEICFIPAGQHGDFIKKFKPAKVLPGDIVTDDGRKVGEHKGISHYTVGQRRGLHLAMGQRYYVKEIRAEENKVVVATRENLLARGLLAKSLNWIAFDSLAEERDVEAQIRYNSKAAKAFIMPLKEGAAEVRFDRPQIAVAPGQSVVFYQDDIVLGGGIIEKPIYND